MDILDAVLHALRGRERVIIVSENQRASRVMVERVAMLVHPSEISSVKRAAGSGQIKFTTGGVIWFGSYRESWRGHSADFVVLERGTPMNPDLQHVVATSRHGRVVRL